MPTIDDSLDYAGALANAPEERSIEDPNVASVAKTGFPRRKIRREPYLPGAELARVVNLAVALGRPLLLQGEPGCGKTQLAHSVAYAFGFPLEVAYVKSTSRAQDLLYTYDAVARLYDSQLGVKEAAGNKGKARARSAANYVVLAPLGRAIARASHSRRSVVLIDEIDKADLDFPNDLLWELDRMEFAVPEAPKLGQNAGGLRPIVIITHNEEKPLPPAFLRRCVYHYVEFPETREQLERILKAHQIKDDALMKKSIEVIGRLRAMDLSKKPGLTELIDWVSYEQARNATPEQMEKLSNMEALLKDRGDQERARREMLGT
jgi:MoxR-like ATPase